CRPSLFRQYKRISTQHYGDGRKDNSRCKLRDLFYFWCGLLLAWRRRQRRLLLWWLRRSRELLRRSVQIIFPLLWRARCSTLFLRFLFSPVWHSLRPLPETRFGWCL